MNMNGCRSVTAAFFSLLSTALLACPVLAAQEPEASAEHPGGADSPGPKGGASGKMTSLVTLIPSIVPIDDYRGDLRTRRAMTGDWGGARTKLADRGIFFDADVTQVLQYNAYGGKSTNNGLQYSGSTDYYFHLDTARLGIWPGGLWKLHGETQFGRSVSSKTGAALSPNFDAMLPLPDDPGETTLSEVYLTQALSKYLMLIAGKIDPTSLADKNAFANSEKTQFLNTGLRNNPIILPFAPYTALIVAMPVMPMGNDTLVIIPFIGNTNDAANITGFNTWFSSPEGTSLGGEIDVKVEPFELPGNLRFGGVWSSKKFPDFAQDRRLLLAQLLTEFESEEGERGVRSFAFWGNFDQYVYLEDGETDQGVGLFGRLGYAPKDSSALNWFFSLGAGGKGIVPRRDDDTFGVGYTFTEISDELTKGPLIPSLKPEQAVEIYYNIEITPWMRLTPDIQFIINPATAAASDNPADGRFALVLGTRLQMWF